MIFFALVAVVLLAVLGWLWLRLVRDTTNPGRVRTVATVALVLLMLTPIAADAGRQVLPRPVQQPLDLVGFGWLGLMLYLVLALVALEPVRWVLRTRLRRTTTGTAPPAVTQAPDDQAPDSPAAHGGAPDSQAPATPAADVGTGPAEGRPIGAGGTPAEDRDVSRRLFLARSLAVTAGAVAVGTAGYGTWAAGAPPVVRRVPIAIAGLAPELAGYRIVTFSDAHLSSLYGRSRFARLVDMVNATEPDLVAVVGDLVDGSVADLRDDVAPLGDLVSRDGAFFVTGNHEYYVDTEDWMTHLPTLGVDVLRNERVAITRGQATFDLAGIDDRTAAASGVPGHGANLDTALDGRDDDTPVVLLAHQPLQVEQARAAGVDLQLSGHTHGGQLWPFPYVVGLEQPAVQGLSRQGDTQLYVTAGVGYWGPPMRVGARPELTVIELHPS